MSRYGSSQVKSAVEMVIGAHHRADVRLLDGDLKRQEIGFLHGALVDDDVHDLAAGLLVVHRIAIDVADHPLVLRALQFAAQHLADQERILAQALEVPPIARLANEVGGSAERHVESEVADFLAQQRAEIVCGLQVPTCGVRQSRGERRGVTPGAADVGDTGPSIGHLQRGDSEAWDSRDVPSAAERFL